MGEGDGGETLEPTRTGEPRLLVAFVWTVQTNRYAATRRTLPHVVRCFVLPRVEKRGKFRPVTEFR